MCGPEQNGAVGLVCARHLRVFVSSKNPRQPRLASEITPQSCSCRNCFLLLMVSQGDTEAGEVIDYAQCLPHAGSAAWDPGLGAKAQ